MLGTVEAIKGQRDRIVARLAELVDLAGHDSELRLLAGGESRDTHGVEPIDLPLAPWRCCPTKSGRCGLTLTPDGSTPSWSDSLD